MTTIDTPAGGYSYIPGVFQYSAGVAASARLSHRARALLPPGAAARGL